MTKQELAQMIDHTNLKADAGAAAIKKLCDEARRYNFKSVCVNGAQVMRCKEYLAGSGVKIAAVAGFPLGQNATSVKVTEARIAIESGANEIDYVLNVADLKEGRIGMVQSEMEAMTDLCHDHGAVIKVIFENCYLTRDEIIKAAQIAVRVRPNFIKTSTGFGTGGATAADVKLMKDTVGQAVAVKAAGGIRDWATAKAMLEAGATRLGVSAGVQIVEEFVE